MIRTAAKWSTAGCTAAPRPSARCDFSTFTFATRAIESLRDALQGKLELHFTYDEEFGGELGPGWLLANGLTRPDLVIAAGFSYQVVTGHNGCLQLEVTVHGRMGHAAVPETAVDALQAATGILNALYEQNVLYKQVRSAVRGINHPYLNVGRIEGGTNTNVVPGKVVHQARPSHDPRGEPGRGRSDDPARDRARRRRSTRTSRSTSDASCSPTRCSRCRATSRWSTRCAPMRARSSASRSRRAARRSTPTPACTASRASRRCCTAPARAPCSKATPSAPTSTSCWTICAVPPRWWRERCTTCSSGAERFFHTGHGRDRVFTESRDRRDRRD